MELNMKDILNAAAAATSEFVKNLYCADEADESEAAVTFETTITLLDKDSTPISVIRSTKTTLTPEEAPAEAEAESAEAEEAQPAAQETPAAAGVYRPPFPGFFGYPYGAMPVADPNAAAMPGAYYGMPFPYAEAVPVGTTVPQQSAPAPKKTAPAAKPADKPVTESVQPPVVKAPKAQESEDEPKTTNQLGTPQLPLNSVREATPDKDRDKIVSMPAEKDEAQSDQAASRAEKIDLLLKKYSNI